MKKCNSLLIAIACFLITLTLQPQIICAQTFEEQTSISLEQISNGTVDWGDYNNDGFLDIVLTGSLISAVYKNNGNNTFTKQLGIVLDGLTSSDAAWGDYNNDGLLDVIIIGTSTSTIYKNNGNNTFTKQTGIQLTGVSYGSVAWGDYDNDGDLDILLSGYAGRSITKIYRNDGGNTFTEQTDISLVSVDGSDVAWGDFDNDGDLDILLSGVKDATTIYSKIYKNNGNSTFTDQTGIQLTGVYNGSVAWGDYDNDGDLDILLAGISSSGRITKIFKNNGNSTFTEKAGVSLIGLEGGSAAWGDYDNDGDLDILLSGCTSGSYPNFTYSTKIYKNEGNDSFIELTGVSLAQVGSSSVAWCDYDNDGDLDFLLSGFLVPSNFTKIYKNTSTNSNSNPTSPNNLSSSIQGNKVLLSWDKATDAQTPQAALSYNVYISTVSNKENVKPCMSNITNGFRKVGMPGNVGQKNSWEANLIGGQTYYWSVQAIDNIFAGGNFAAEKSFTVPVVRPTVQVSNFVQSNSTTDQTTIKWNNGNGTYRVAFASEGTGTPPIPLDNTTYTANPTIGLGSQLGSGWYCVSNGYANTLTVKGLQSGNSYQLVVFEYDGVAGTELYNSSVSTNIFSFKSNIFVEQTSISLEAVSNGTAVWGDYDNDGDLDILLSGNVNTSSKVYRNNGNNTFTLQTEVVLPALNAASAAWADFNNDGNLDILLAGSTKTELITKVFTNNGNNTFSEQTEVTLLGIANGCLSICDNNSDGKLDILMNGTITSGKTSRIYNSNSNNTYTALGNDALPIVDGRKISWGDYDSDGDLDILLTGRLWGVGQISRIYKNNGNNTYTEQKQISLIAVTDGLGTWGDYDNDGDLDLLLNGTSDYLGRISRIYKNNGDNTLTEQSQIILPSLSDSFTYWGDFDNDGDLDILLASSSVSKIFVNNGNNTFSESIEVSLPGCETASCGDYDNDGDLDILLTSSGSSSAFSKIFKNSLINSAPKTSNNAPLSPSNLNIISNLNGNVTFGWDKSTDTETPQNGLSYNLYVYNSNLNTLYYSPNSFRQTETQNGRRLIAQQGNIQHGASGFTLYNLPNGLYKWSVQAIDGGFKGGEFAPEQSFTVLNLRQVGVNVAGGVLTETDPAMAYSFNSTDGVNGTWTNCTAATTAVDFGTGGFDVWVKAITNPTNKIKIASIAAQITPTFDIDYIAEQTVQVIADTVEYSTNADLIGAVTGNGVKIPVTPEQNIYFRLKATAKRVTSTIQTLTVPARQTTPTFTIDYVNETMAQELTNLYEYSAKSDMSSASAGANSKLSIAPDQIIYIRKKATATAFKSLIQTLTGTRLPTPSYTIDFISEMTNEIFIVTDQYSMGDYSTPYGSGDGQKMTLSPCATYKFRSKANATNFQSLIQTLIVPARPEAPTSPIVNDNTNTFDWTISQGYSNASDYEYSIDNGATWAVCSTKPVVVGDLSLNTGYVMVRVKANAVHFKSLELKSTSNFLSKIITLESLGISCYPNPAKEFFVLENVPSKGELAIYALDGISMKKMPLAKGTNRIDVSVLPSGMYMLILNLGNTQVQSKIVKQ